MLEAVEAVRVLICNFFQDEFSGSTVITHTYLSEMVAEQKHKQPHGVNNSVTTNDFFSLLF